jgi:hypothetical protein
MGQKTNPLCFRLGTTHSHHSVWIEEPKLQNKYGSNRVTGRVRLDNIEQYAQIVANLYGWTTPDARIFYKNGVINIMSV